MNYFKSSFKNNKKIINLDTICFFEEYISGKSIQLIFNFLSDRKVFYYNNEEDFYYDYNRLLEQINIKY